MSIATDDKQSPLMNWHDGVGLLWDVYGHGKWFKRIVSPIGWDAHTVYCHMQAARYAPHIEIRLVSSTTDSSPDEPLSPIAEVCEDADGFKHIESVIEDLDDMPTGTRLYATRATAPSSLKRAELYDHMLECAKGAGFDSLTAAIAEAKAISAQPYAEVIAHIKSGGVVKVLSHDEAVADANAFRRKLERMPAPQATAHIKE